MTSSAQTVAQILRSLETNAARLQVARTKRTELILEARDRNLSLREIAKVTGMSHTAVANIIAAHDAEAL